VQEAGPNASRLFCSQADFFGNSWDDSALARMSPDNNTHSAPQLPTAYWLKRVKVTQVVLEFCCLFDLDYKLHFAMNAGKV